MKRPLACKDGGWGGRDVCVCVCGGGTVTAAAAAAASRHGRTVVLSARATRFSGGSASGESSAAICLSTSFTAKMAGWRDADGFV